MRLGSATPMALALRVFVCLAALAVAGCFPPDEGRAPSLEALYFPVGLAIDETATRLYVANSDFDLQFNAGTLQAYDLEQLRHLADEFRPRPGVADSCGALGRKGDADRLLSPGECGHVDPVFPPDGGSILVSAVEIGAFVTDVIYRSNPELEGGRLFLPVRGDATLHWVDVQADAEELECGQGAGKRCDGNHRRGDSPAAENSRGAALPPEPYGIAADARGEAIVVTHQLDGQVALFTNEWAGGAAGGPRLEFVQGGLPSGAVAIESVPEAPAAKLSRTLREEAQRLLAVAEPSDALAEAAAGVQWIAHQPAFLVSFRNAAQVRLLRFFDDVAASPARPFLDLAGARQISAVSQGFEARGIGIDAQARQSCEAACGAECDAECAAENAGNCSCSTDDSDCMAACDPEMAAARLRCGQECIRCNLACSEKPLGVYVSNRRPNTLIVGKTPAVAPGAPPNDLPTFYDALPVSPGAARVIVGDVLGPDGQPKRRIFLLCFDSRKIYIYDPVGRRFEKVVDTGRGPHALAIDTRSSVEDPSQNHAYGYIGHFTDSYIGVLDLDQRRSTYGEIILTVGRPTPPRASK